jgi:hypothetical protein
MAGADTGEPGRLGHAYLPAAQTKLHPHPKAQPVG